MGSRPKRVEPSGQLAEHCVETLRGDLVTHAEFTNRAKATRLARKQAPTKETVLNKQTRPKRRLTGNRKRKPQAMSRITTLARASIRNTKIESSEVSYTPHFALPTLRNGVTE